MINYLSVRLGQNRVSNESIRFKEISVFIIKAKIIVYSHFKFREKCEAQGIKPRPRHGSHLGKIGIIFEFFLST